MDDERPSTLARIIKAIVVALIVALGYYLFNHFYTPPAPKTSMFSNGKNAPQGMVWLPGGEFQMGSNSHLAKHNEMPAHAVRIDGFWVDQNDVTNAQFAQFVQATGYVTTAERKPDWETLKVQLPPDTPPPPADKLVAGAMVFTGTDHPVPLDNNAQWWKFEPGANWRHPQGPNSTITGKENYPVVQVSYEDAEAYAKWAGKRLLTEAEWEYAARGGLDQANFSWGNLYQEHDKRMANTFAGKVFPVVEPGMANQISASKVASYPPNGYQLYDMAGNVWQWVADWYRADAFVQEARLQPAHNPTGPTDSFDPADTYAPADAPKRVIRGGSFLCDPNFCMSYRPSARRGVDPYNPMEHIGFRLMMTAQMAQAYQINRE